MKTTIQNGLMTLIGAATLVASVVTGAEAADVPQVHVSYADRDLHSPAGAAVLNRRINAAAERVCAVFDDRDPAHRAHFNACMTGAVAAALSAAKTSDAGLAANK